MATVKAAALTVPRSAPLTSLGVGSPARRSWRPMLSPQGLSSHPCSLTSSTALVCSGRSFYEKIRDQRDGSDDGPDQMFSDFVKSPHRQRVPAELHRGNKDAVDGAEQLNRIFFVFLVVFLAGVIGFIDPFNGDQYERPEGYGVTDPKVVYGSSDGAHRRA